MSADIEKLAVFDDRIVQTRPKYAVEKGALSLTNSPFNAISQTQSQHTYNIYVPSENVYVSRDLEWGSTVYLGVNVRLTTADPAVEQYPAGEPLLTLGVDGSLSAFPLNALCATMTATINDTTVTINSQDVLTEVLRLTDYSPNRLQRTCPTMLDKYQSNGDALDANNDPIAAYATSQYSPDEIGNGTWNNIVFTKPDGSAIAAVGADSYTVPSGPTVDCFDGIPLSTVQGDGTTVNGLYQVYLKWRTTEKLVLSPFIFSEEYSQDTGLFGINNIQLVMNMRDPNRAMRLRDSVVGTARKYYYGGGLAPNTWTAPIFYNTNVGSGVFSDSVVNCQFLTPSLDIPLPPKSCVPYMEFPRYITQPQNVKMAAGDVTQLQSQTITLPQIPDLLIIYCKATSSNTAEGSLNDRSRDPSLPQFGSGYLPIATGLNGTRGQAPLSINFDNFSGLLSSVTAEQLYHMSVRNGLEMDWNTWSGQARVTSNTGGSLVPTVGGFLVLKPSMDLTLQSGQAPSLVGNFTLQFNITVRNTYPFDIQPQIYVITANSGFFESIRGSSRIIKGVLSEQDIISAPLAPAGTRAGLARMIGGKMMALANRLGMVKSHSGQSGSSGHSGAMKSDQKVGGMKTLSSRLM